MNEIEDIFWDSVSSLPSLQTLDLGSNKFIKILGGTLQAMPGIRRLKLSNNHINEIDRGALSHLEDLGKHNKYKTNNSTILCSNFKAFSFMWQS